MRTFGAYAPSFPTIAPGPSRGTGPMSDAHHREGTVESGQTDTASTIYNNINAICGARSVHW
jgi:hypothetical protein